VLGLVNEPGFRAASKPDEFGLWLDEEAEPEPQASIEQSTGSLRVCSVFGFFRIRISTRKRARNGMAIVS
jgi:hypothetical protein